MSLVKLWELQRRHTTNFKRNIWVVIKRLKEERQGLNMQLESLWEVNLTTLLSIPRTIVPLLQVCTEASRDRIRVFKKILPNSTFSNKYQIILSNVSKLLRNRLWGKKICLPSTFTGLEILSHLNSFLDLIASNLCNWLFPTKMF